MFPMNPLTNGERFVANKTQVYPHMFGKNNPGTGPLPYLQLPFSGAVNAFGPVDDFYAYLASQMPTGVRPDEAILTGLIYQKAHFNGHFVDKGLADLNIASCFTPHLFVSVPALTTFRGRIHGIPNYHKLREIYAHAPIYGKTGCPNPTDLTTPDPIACFLRMTEDDVDLATMLRDTFSRLDRIDPWFGIMIEQETSLWPLDAALTKTAIEMAVDQFNRLRYGDRFWYENQEVLQFSEQELEDIAASTLKNVISEHFPALAGHLPEDILQGRDDLTTF
jgi:hypothetical protein